MELRRVDQACEVLVDGRWLAGDLRYWRQTPEGRWQGYVHYTLDIGAVHVRWVDQDKLRQLET